MGQNRQEGASRPGIVNNKPFNRNRPGFPNKPNGNLKQGGGYRQGDFNKTGSKFNNQRPSGIRKPVSPNELMQLQKTNASDKEKLNRNNTEKQKIESPKQKVKAPNSRPNAIPASKKPPHRAFSNSSKKPGKTDWDDSAKLEALRNKEETSKINNKNNEPQLSFFKLEDPILEELRDDIIDLDIDTLTPIEALMKLNEIKKLLGK